MNVPGGWAEGWLQPIRPPVPGRRVHRPDLRQHEDMPGLPSRLGGERIDIDADGNVVGLF